MPITLNYNPCAVQSMQSRNAAMSVAQKSLDQASRGKINPIEDPSSAVLAAVLKADTLVLNQANRNNTQAQSLLKFAAEKVRQMTDDVSRKLDLATENSNTSINPEQRDMVIMEFQSLLKNLEQNARSTYNNIPLFTGGSTSFAASATVNGSAGGLQGAVNGTAWQAPAVMGDVTGSVSAVTVVKTGNAKTVSVTIGGQEFKGALQSDLATNKETVKETVLTASSGATLTLKVSGNAFSVDNADENARITAIGDAIRAHLSGVSVSPALSSDLGVFGAGVKMSVSNPSESKAYGLSYAGNNTFKLYDFDKNVSVGSARLDGDKLLFAAEGIRFTGVTVPANGANAMVGFVSDGNKVPAQHQFQIGLTPAEKLEFTLPDLTLNGLGLDGISFDNPAAVDGAFVAIRSAFNTLLKEQAKLTALTSQAEATYDTNIKAINCYEEARSSTEDVSFQESLVQAKMEMSKAKNANAVLNLSMQLMDLNQEMVQQILR